MLLSYHVQVFTNVETYITGNTNCINYKDESQLFVTDADRDFCEERFRALKYFN